MTTFPTDPWVKAEAFIGGAWVDVTADTDDVDGHGRVSGTTGITITRGKAIGAQRANPGQCQATIFNRDGKYYNRNPRSTFFGKLPLNVPFRVTALPYESYVRLESSSLASERIVAADSAALSVTGDLELRFDVEPNDVGEGAYLYPLASKYLITGNQRSWYVFLNFDKPVIYWSPDGTFTNIRSAQCDAAIPKGRFSLKIQVDVNNGAGGVTTKFFTAKTIDGTYTQLGTTQISAGTSSIFDSTASVILGSGSNGGFGIASDYNLVFQGKYYQFRIYNGLTGTLAAKADLTNLQIGDITYSDGTTIWLIAPPSYVDSDKIRYYGFIPRWPIAWDSAGRDIKSAITAYGKLQVLSSGANVLDSAMTRYYSSLTANVGYWTGEDGADAVQLSARTGKTAAAQATNVKFAQQSTLPGSAPLFTIDETSSVRGVFPAHTGTNKLSFTYAVFIDKAPTIQVPTITFKTTTGLIGQFLFDNTGHVVNFYQFKDAILATATSVYGAGAGPGQWFVFVYELQQSGANVTWAVNWRTQDPSIGYAFGGTINSFTLGKLASWNIPPLVAGSGLTTYAYGHIAGSTSVDDYLEFPHLNSFRGYVGETDIVRAARLSDEEGVTLIVRGKSSRAIQMGPQTQKTYPDLLDECANTGQGYISEARSSEALIYTAHDFLELNGFTDIAYTDSLLTEGTVTDDLAPVNYVTVTRNNGGSSTAITTTGPKSVAVIGTQADPQTLNLFSDRQTRDVAEWMRHVGSWDELRWDKLTVELTRTEVLANPTILNSMYGLDILRGLSVSALPNWLPVRESRLLVESYTEKLTRFLFSLSLDTSVARPYATAKMYDKRVKIGSSTSKLTTGINAAVTSLSVTCDAHCKWVFQNNFYISVDNDREKMLVTNITGTASPFTFSVTRGSPAFSHLANVSIELWDQRVLGL